MTRTVLEGGAIATMDDAGSEYAEGHVVVEGTRLVEVGRGTAPPQHETARRVDTTGCLVTPGLVNTHHHLYQWATRGFAVDANLFEWLTELYPRWARLDEETTGAAARAGLARLARSGCSTVADHHYVFPRGGGDVFAAVIDAAEHVGVRLHAVRGSMDRGRSSGGLPPDEVVEDRDEALAATQAAIEQFHDPRPGSRLHVGVGPCSPFSVSQQLMLDAAGLAREHDVRLHTHLAETTDEEQQCQVEFGRTPAEYVERLGWTGPDVWIAHGCHLHGDAIARLAETGTGVAHCPGSNARLGAGSAPVRELLDAGVPVGLGVDGVAAYEDGGLAEQLRYALFTARLRGGPRALAARETLWMATRGGARCLGRESELGSIEPGKLADLAVWRMDGPDHAGISDLVTALVLGPLPTVDLLMCGANTVVNRGQPQHVASTELARDLRRACARVAD